MNWEEIDHRTKQYTAAYDVIRYAMTLVDDDNVCSKLQMLKNVLHIAEVFVHEELDQLPEQAEELGLDKWQEEEKEWEQEQDAAEGLDEEEAADNENGLEDDNVLR